MKIKPQLKRAAVSIGVLCLILFFCLLGGYFHKASSRRNGEGDERIIGGAESAGKKKGLKVERRAKTPPAYVAIDTDTWLAKYCKEPSTDELRNLLKRGDITSAERAGVIWLDPSLIYEALEGQELDDHLLLAALAMLPRDYPIKDLDEMVASCGSPSGEMYQALAKRYADEGDYGKSLELLSKAGSLSDPARLSYFSSAKAALVGIGRSDEAADVYMGVRTRAMFPLEPIVQKMIADGKSASFTPEQLKVVIDDLSRTAKNDQVSPYVRIFALRNMEDIGNNLNTFPGLAQDLDTKADLADAVGSSRDDEANLMPYFRVLRNQEMIHDQLAEVGADRDYYSIIGTQGDAAGYKWLKDNYPDIFKAATNQKVN